MRSGGFSILLLLLLSANAAAQYRASGTVMAASDSSLVRDCIVYLNNEKTAAVTDSRGRFAFEDLANGDYTLHFLSADFAYHSTTFTVVDANVHIPVLLAARIQELAEVVVTEVPSGFAMTRMRAVENVGIYESKKSEVIIPGQLVANLATNNARQLYSRVAGLNIWENDGAGLQLSIGARGLDPNRTSNFNVRQNGYDISADALGYPESYYTPPSEAIGRIQIVRGAASLQYGTQFGGLINFSMKKPLTDRKLGLLARQSVGSFGFYNSFTSASGTIDKLSYYSFFQYKRGNGWRENSSFTNHTFFANVNYAASAKTRFGIDITQMGYLAQQPGGLTDDMFAQAPRQTNRARNWFNVNWNLMAFHFDHKPSASAEFNLRVFGLSAHRYATGFRPNRVATVDDDTERDLVKGCFRNWGAEARYLKRYAMANKPSVVLVGTRFYQGFNHSMQGLGSTGKDADFDFAASDQSITHDYRFPNRNISLFAENIFYLHEKLSLTPGLRVEHISTKAEGYYSTVTRDLAGNVIEASKTDETRTNARNFMIAGVGVSYRPTLHIDIYSNISQNYRSITFNDMRIVNPSSIIDPDLGDEKGYSFDIGMRSEQTTILNYDVSYFYLNYNNRIGEVQYYDEYNRVLRKRTNIGRAVIQGLELYGELDFVGYLFPRQSRWSGTLFNNVAFIHSRYRASEEAGVVGNDVEFVPRVNLKSGFRVGYRNVQGSFQYTHVSDQFADATNAVDGGVSAVTGVIPAYSIMDLSLAWQLKRFRLEGSVNNLADERYFTRRASGYPGPGILPSDGRSFYLTVGLKL